MVLRVCDGPCSLCGRYFHDVLRHEKECKLNPNNDYTLLLSNADWEFARWVNTLVSRVNNQKISLEEYHRLWHLQNRWKWFPIETAPKDGTPVNLRFKNNAVALKCDWKRGRDRDPRCGPEGISHHLEHEGWSEVGSTEGNGSLMESEITHWMPWVKITGDLE